MTCPPCESTATTERPARTELGYRRFRCRDCRRGFNERTGTPFNRRQYPTDVLWLVVLWRFRYKLSLRDLAEMFLQRGIIITREAVRERESKLAPLLCASADRVGAGHTMANDSARADGLWGLGYGEPCDSWGCPAPPSRRSRVMKLITNASRVCRSRPS
jgi:hypothetical protein